MRKIWPATLLFVCSVAAAQNLSPEVKQFVKVDAPVVALEHVRVIDGTDTAAAEDQTVLLANGRVESVGAAAEAKVPANAQILEIWNMG